MRDLRELPALYEAAAAAARAAAELLVGARPTGVRAKANPRDLVTEWDERSEAKIREVLEDRWPGVPVLGEEGGGESGAARGLRWLVDSIDGTVNFAHGLPVWCISIAVEDETGVLAGVVHAPALGWWFDAIRGSGARDGSGTRLQVSRLDDLGQALLATGFPYDASTDPDNNFAAWEHLYKTAGSCRRFGSAALDLCMVARGWFDGYWERKLKPWDVAAGTLIVAEAGGTVTNTRGGRFDLHEGEVVATNGAIHQGLVAELATIARRSTAAR